MNTAFNDEIDEKFAKLDLYPEDKEVRKEIDSQNDWVYNTVRSDSLIDWIAWNRADGFRSRAQVNNVSFRISLGRSDASH